MENTILPGDKLIYLTGSDVRRGESRQPGSDRLPGRCCWSGGSSGCLVIAWPAAPRRAGNGERAGARRDGRLSGRGCVADAVLRPARAGEAWLMGDKRAVADDSRYRGPVADADRRPRDGARSWRPVDGRANAAHICGGRPGPAGSPARRASPGLSVPPRRCCACCSCSAVSWAWIRGRIVRRRLGAAAPVADGAADGAALHSPACLIIRIRSISIWAAKRRTSRPEPWSGSGRSARAPGAGRSCSSG